MRTVLIFGIVILVAGCLYGGTRLTHRMTRLQLWIALALALGGYGILLWTQIAAWPISDMAVMLVALLAASVIGFTLNSSSALIAFCIAAGLVDVFSFSGGLTAKIVADYQQGRNLLLQYLSLVAPLPDRITPIVGIGDLIILGSIYYAFPKIGLHSAGAFLFPLGGLLIALGVGLLIGGIYALPFIGGATILHLVIKGRMRSSQSSGPATSSG